MSVYRNVFIALLVVGVVQVIIYYPQLPGVMASHFDGAGHPNGWQSKATFFAIDLAMMGIMALSFLWAPGLMHRFSHESWSLPNKSYWLAPARLFDTIRFMQDQLLLFGSVTLVFLIAVFQLAIEANLNPPPVLSAVTGRFIAAYFGFTVFWLVRLFRRFYNVPSV